MDLSQFRRVYFIGVGGIGMSGLARYFNSRGLAVSGYDLSKTSLTSQLEDEGIDIHFDVNMSSVPKDVANPDLKGSTLVVYTPAIPEKHEELNFFIDNQYTIKEEYKKVLWSNDLNWEEGQHDVNKILESDEVIKSPGIPDDVELIVELKKKGVPVISEIEFAYRYTNARIIGVTGSNGKTTTTLLIHHILKNGGLNVGLVGNIGESFAKQVAIDDKIFRFSPLYL